jgi:hypothetical protein
MYGNRDAKGISVAGNAADITHEHLLYAAVSQVNEADHLIQAVVLREALKTFSNHLQCPAPYATMPSADAVHPPVWDNWRFHAQDLWNDE